MFLSRYFPHPSRSLLSHTHQSFVRMCIRMFKCTRTNDTCMNVLLLRARVHTHTQHSALTTQYPHPFPMNNLECMWTREYTHFYVYLMYVLYKNIQKGGFLYKCRLAAGGKHHIFPKRRGAPCEPPTPPPLGSLPRPNRLGSSPCQGRPGNRV